MFNKNKENNIDIFHSLYKEVFESLDQYFKANEFNIDLEDKDRTFNLCVLTHFIASYSLSKIEFKPKQDKYIDDLTKLNYKFFISFFNSTYKIDTFSNLSAIINDKFSNLKDIRSNYKPPDCWYLIFSEIFGLKDPNYFKSEIKKFEKGISIIEGSQKVKSIKDDCELKLQSLKNTYSLFDKSEMKFREVIRKARTRLKSINIKSAHKDLKSINDA